jgi:hypothetical protein
MIVRACNNYDLLGFQDLAVEAHEIGHPTPDKP